MMKILTLIPARMASTRLPDKPLADIAGKPMIVHVAERARAAGLGRTVVATDNLDVKAAVEAHGLEAVMTRNDHESGSDRIYEALLALDPDRNVDAVVNVQGDLPTIETELIKRALLPLQNGPADIGTLGVEIRREDEKTNPNVVKIIGSPMGKDQLRALYFTRATAPWGRAHFTIISGFTPIAAPLSNVLSASDRRLWNAASGSNSCARWRPACASMWKSSTRCRWASIRPKTSNAHETFSPLSKAIHHGKDQPHLFPG